jgi:hypothetical protein
LTTCAVSTRYCCDCSHPSGSYSRCEDCRAAECRRRDERQANGQCRRCADPVETLGDRRCIPCALADQEARRKRAAEDRAAGVCCDCRQRTISRRSKSRCEVCLAKQRKAGRDRLAAKAEQERLDREHGNELLRQTMECLRADGVEPPAELVELCRERGVEC